MSYKNVFDNNIRKCFYYFYLKNFIFQVLEKLEILPKIIIKHTLSMFDILIF